MYQVFCKQFTLIFRNFQSINSTLPVDMSTRTELKVLQYRRTVVVEKQTGCQQLETKPYQTRKKYRKGFGFSLSPFISLGLGNALLKECCPADAFFIFYNRATRIIFHTICGSSTAFFPFRGNK